jgi:phosphatidylethanolamine-binding protein (PEBP) family uncharacterized protein
MKLLYEAFMKEFYTSGKFPFPPNTTVCPFGPNWGAEHWPYVCSLEAPYDSWGADAVRYVRSQPLGGSPWEGPQRAFFLPNAYIDEAWNWVNENRFHTDVLRHPNTGCMHDDHSVRANWTVETAGDTPDIEILNFPCNMPGTGCNDSLWVGPPACNCGDELPLPNDNPANTCKFCIANGGYVEDLKFECTEPALLVNYSHIEYYNGEVSCGNLFLESDIGGGINVAPIVKFPDAKEGTYYTLVMMDPDADLPNNGSWPDVTTPGSHAPVRHWVVGNIDAAALKSGDFSSATTVESFLGPSPPFGSHRYGQFLFAQNQRQNFSVYASNASRTQWDWKGWLGTYAMSEPVASNWHVTQQAAPRSKVRQQETVTVI